MSPTSRAGKAPIAYALLALVPALLSFALFRLTRAVLKLVKNRYTRKHPESSRTWQVMNGEFIRKPLVLPLIMTGSPRWNTHAVIGTLGPFSVRSRFSIDLAPVTAATRDWFFVIYSHPAHKTVGSLSCLSEPGGEQAEFEVPHPGEYVIGARYYHLFNHPEFPVVTADGTPVNAPRKASSDNNRFYEELARVPDRFYRCLHFYMWAALRCRTLLPKQWLDREFLPVGNPETQFHYGILLESEEFSAPCDRALLREHSVFITLYSRASIPVQWLEITADTSNPVLRAPQDCFYLVRIQRKSESALLPRRPDVEYAA